MQEWQLTTVGDLCDLVNGNSFKSDDWSQTGLPIIRIQNLNGSRDFNYFDKIPRAEWSVETGDLLFAWSGVKGVSFGPKIWSGPKGVLNQHIFRVIINTKILDKRWFFYTLVQITQKIEENAHGFKSSFVHVKKGDITSQQIWLPPLPEQQKIAEILGSWDTAIEQLETLIEKKQLLKRGLMQKLLSGKIRFRKHIRQAGNKKQSSYFEEKLGYIPNDWSSAYFPEVVFYQEGPGVRKYQFTNEGVKLLNGSNIVNNRLLTENTDRYVSEEEAYGKYKHFLVDAGDLIIASSGITAEKFSKKIAFVESRHLPICMNTSTIRFKSLNSGILSIIFFRYFLESDYFVNQVNRHAVGSAQLNFGPSHLEKSVVILPSIAEQENISDLLVASDSEVHILEQQLACLKTQKLGLMQQLLTGKIRVQVDEPTQAI